MQITSIPVVTFQADVYAPFKMSSVWKIGSDDRKRKRSMCKRRTNSMSSRRESCRRLSELTTTRSTRSTRNRSNLALNLSRKVLKRLNNNRESEGDRRRRLSSISKRLLRREKKRLD